MVCMHKDSPIQFKGSSLNIIQALLRTADPLELGFALEELTGNSPDFFENELAVMDFSGVIPPPEAIDWSALSRLLRDSGLQPFATHGLPDDLAASAAAAGFSVLTSDMLGKPGRPAAPPVAQPVTQQPVVDKPVSSEALEQLSLPLTPAHRPAQILDRPLRSGQRFYARDADLIVLAMVSAGAEVIADGHVHVYAPLRGRALAGAQGDQRARIFTTCMEAELVSIAGIYRTFDAGMARELAAQPVMVSLQETAGQQSLNVSTLTIR